MMKIDFKKYNKNSTSKSVGADLIFYHGSCRARTRANTTDR